MALLYCEFVIFTYPSSRAFVVVVVGRAPGVVDEGEDGGARLVDADQVVSTRGPVPDQTQEPDFRVFW